MLSNSLRESTSRIMRDLEERNIDKLTNISFHRFSTAMVMSAKELRKTYQHFQRSNPIL